MNLAERPKSDPNLQHLVKLKSGEAVMGIFVGNFYTFKQSWPGQERPSFRFRANFMIVDQPTGAVVPKILEGGGKLYDQLVEINKGLKSVNGDMSKMIVRIGRSGSGKNDTTYSAMCVPTAPDPTVLDKAKSQPLFKLEKPEDQAAQSSGDPSL